MKQARIHKTFVAKPADIEREWYVVDATDLTLGRLATQVASVLRGKHKPEYTPYEDVGDFVVVINAEKGAGDGRKWDQKMYYHHWLSAVSSRSACANNCRRSCAINAVAHAAARSVGPSSVQKLKVYAGPEHPLGQLA